MAHQHNKNNPTPTNYTDEQMRAYQQQMHYNQMMYQQYMAYQYQMGQYPQPHFQQPGMHQGPNYGGQGMQRHYQTPYNFAQKRQNRHEPTEHRQHREHRQPRQSRQHRQPRQSPSSRQLRKQPPKPAKHVPHQSDSQHSSLSQQIPLAPIKDPVLHSPEQIRKWIAARKRNYPTRKRIELKKSQQQETGELPQYELSKLEVKLRKQIQFSNASKWQLENRWRNMDLIRSIITEPLRRNKPIHKKREKKDRRDGYEEREKSPQKELEKQPEVNKDEDDDAPPQEIPMGKGHAHNKKIQSFIEFLKTKRTEQQQNASKMFDYKDNSANFKYTKNTLMANMILDDIFKENCYLLQAIRYIVKNDFLEKEEKPEVVPEQEVQEGEWIEDEGEIEEGEVYEGVEEGEVEQGEIEDGQIQP